MELNKTEESKKFSKEDQYTRGNPESQIRQLVEDFKQALNAGDIETIMSFYAPDVVAFDLVPPIQYVGKDVYRKSWEKTFADFDTTASNSSFEIYNLNVSADENLAFSHSLSHCFGKMKNGSDVDMWMRSTICYKKINGKWLITHEQISVPVDFETGKAMLDLKPDKNQLH